MENASAVDARGGVSTVAVALGLLVGGAETASDGIVGGNSCVGVVKVSVEVKEYVSVGISASWPWKAAVCPLVCS